MQQGFFLYTCSCMNTFSFAFLFLFYFLFFLQLPTLFSMHSSPPNVLGGSAFFFFIDQKQEPHGTQSMGFYFYFLPPTPNPLFNAFKPTHCAGWVSSFYFPPTPNPLPSGKRALRFASPGFNLHHFYFLLIDVSLFKDRGVAMGKPHCNSSI